MVAVSEASEVEARWQLAADLRVAVGRITRRVRQEHRTGDLSFPEISVLSRLDRCGSASPGGLAQAEGVKPQAMAVTVARLEERHLVVRAADATDARRAVISVAPRGADVLAEARRAGTAVLNRGLVGFSESELACLRTALPLLERLAAGL